MRTTLILLALAVAVPALADGSDGAPVVKGAPLEVVVTADPYARWEHTRWRVDTQVGLPYPVPLYATVNHEVHVVAVDLSLVLACELGGAWTRHSREAECVVQDAALRAAPWLRDPPGGQAVVEETDRLLTGLRVRLQVTEDGEIADVGLVGEPERNRRTSIQYENLRQLVSRAFVGFHMTVPERFEVGKTWYERNSRLFSMPAFRWLAIADGGLPALDAGTDGALYLDGAGPADAALVDVDRSNPQRLVVFDIPRLPSDVRTPISSLRVGRNSFDVLQAPATLGFSSLAHKLDVHRGRYLVQTRGEGSVDIGLERPMTFKGTVEAASVFDPGDAVMTERVWTLKLAPTAGSVLAEGVAGWPYWHNGRLTKLGPDEHPDLGASSLVGWPGLPDGRGQLAPWPVLQ